MTFTAKMMATYWLKIARYFGALAAFQRKLKDVNATLEINKTRIALADKMPLVSYVTPYSEKRRLMCWQDAPFRNATCRCINKQLAVGLYRGR